MRFISIVPAALQALQSLAAVPQAPQRGTNISPRDNDATRKVPFGGVNISGFDFGCKPFVGCNPFATDGTGANVSVATAGTGAVQMTHFVSKGLNTFRLPVAWEYLADSPGTLNVERFKVYDQLVQGCLNSGAKLCIVDLHNYCRWRDSNGVTGVVAHDGPTQAEFASFWGQLASHYANQDRVAFDLMNEPHDLPYPVQTWADATKAAIDEIRKVGANLNKIIITGSSFSSVWEFQAQQHDAIFGPMMKIVDSDGSNNRLVIGLHQYVDGVGGTTPNCIPNPGGITYQAFFVNAAKMLTGRSAVIAEIGGGNNNACVDIICPILDTINSRSEFIGITMWSAGSWWSNYELLLTPLSNGQDQLLAEKCLIPKVGGD